MHKVKAPPPGVYTGVPFETYLTWDAVSQSMLSELRRSPAHLKAMLAAPDDDLDNLRIGRAVHCLTLEGIAEFDKRFGIFPNDLTRQSKEGKAAWAAIQAEGKTPLKESEYEATKAMRDALERHTAARTLLASEGPTELSIVWVDEATGVTCKARHDKHAHSIGGGVILDVKTTTDASPREFERAIFNFGYHRQGAFYIRAAAALNLPVSHYAILAVEKESPFAVSVYRLNEGALDCGDGEIDVLLRLWAKCQKEDGWPAYPETVQDIALPDWAWAVSDRITQEIKRGLGE